MTLASPRIRRLIGIAGALAAVCGVIWVIGWWTDLLVLRFAGLMLGAGTFLPLPADTFVLAVSPNLHPVTVGVVGGLANTAAVLVERSWIRTLVDHPAFARFSAFFDTSRVVGWTSRNMFVALLVGAASFIPFEPFRLIAVMRDYSPWRYALATFIARGGRYYVLAALGNVLLDIGILQQAIWVAFALFLVGVWRMLVRLIRMRREPAPLPEAHQ
ncbi:MAG: hypothetical protein AAF467_01965 [Actinomycetota bacterium]